MYILFSLALSLSIWGWWATSPFMFYASVLFSIFVMLYIDVRNKLSPNGFFNTAISIMESTECCLVHRLWSQPTSVRWTSISFRTLAGLTAIVATYVSWQRRNTFLTGHHTLISILWVAASTLCLMSCIPMFICLVQCAANPTLKKNTTLKISGRELILRFRKVYTLWLLHDVVLGVFWVYLSTMLFDLADDIDDSEWRTIFLSMLSWHIIVILLHSVYFEHLATVHPLPSAVNQQKPCCSPERAKPLWGGVLVLTYAGMYTVVILRMQDDALLELGFDSILYPIIFTGSCLLNGLSRAYIHTLNHSHVKLSSVSKPSRSTLTLDF